jgi:hypothetical protein
MASSLGTLVTPEVGLVSENALSHELSENLVGNAPAL